MNTISTGQSVLDSPRAWRQLGLAMLAATVGNVGMWSYILVMPMVQAEFGLDRAEATLPYTFAMFGFALGNFVLGAAVDRFGLRLVLIASACLLAAGHVASTLVGNVAGLALVQFFVGFGAAANFGPLVASMSLWFKKRRGIAVALAASANYLSGAVWPIVIGNIFVGWTWQSIYLAIAFSVVAVVVPVALTLSRRPADPVVAAGNATPVLETARPIVSSRALLWLLVIAGVGCCVAMSMPQVHIISYCVDLGYGPAVGGQMLSTMLLAGILSRLVSGMLADRIGGVATLLLGSSLQCLGLFLYLPFDGLVSLYIVSLIFGLSQGGIVPAYAIIVREYLPAKEAGAKVGLVMMATILGMALGGWMSGWIYDLTGSYHAAFLNGIAWNLLNIAIIGGLWFRLRRAPPTAFA